MGGIRCTSMHSYSWQQTEMNGQLKILAAFDLVLIRTKTR
jgi:hypothetical protein